MRVSMIVVSFLGGVGSSFTWPQVGVVDRPLWKNCRVAASHQTPRASWSTASGRSIAASFSCRCTSLSLRQRAATPATPADAESQEASKARLMEDLRTIRRYNFNILGVMQVFLHHLVWMGFAAVVAALLRIPKVGLGHGFRIWNRKALLMGTLSSVPLFLHAFLVAVVYYHVVGRIESAEMSTERLTLLLLGGVFRPIPALLASIGMGFLAGLSEEIVFRGVLQYELSKRLCGWIPVMSKMALPPSFWAVVVTSIIFSAFHTQYTTIQSFDMFLLSSYMGWLYYHAGGNLAVPVIAHSVYDAAMFFASHIDVTKLSVKDQVKLEHGVLVSER